MKELVFRRLKMRKLTLEWTLADLIIMNGLDYIECCEDLSLRYCLEISFISELLNTSMRTKHAPYSI